jgi:hypothetical protein
MSALHPLQDIDRRIGKASPSSMADGRWWVALVTFERREAYQEILPDWAHGACGWMAALATSREEARHRLVRDVEHHGLRVLEVANEREVFDGEEIDAIDEHLAANFRAIEPGAQTVWGTIHGYKGEGEA